MSFARIHALTTVEFQDHKALRAGWKLYKRPLTLALVSRFTVKKPLTSSQLRRLPKGLRERLN